MIRIVRSDLKEDDWRGHASLDSVFLHLSLGEEADDHGSRSGRRAKPVADVFHSVDSRLSAEPSHIMLL